MVSGLTAGINVGSEEDEPSPGGGHHILPIAVPDGNQPVFCGE